MFNGVLSCVAPMFEGAWGSWGCGAPIFNVYMNAGSFMRESDKHQQIIEAAVRVFARNGYYNSRVSDVAREAGVASGTIYLYFKTKDDILVTLFREKMAAWVSFVREEIKGEGDPVAKIRRLVALHFSVLEKDPALAEVVQVELR